MSLTSSAIVGDSTAATRVAAAGAVPVLESPATSIPRASSATVSCCAAWSPGLARTPRSNVSALSPFDGPRS